MDRSVYFDYAGQWNAKGSRKYYVESDRMRAFLGLCHLTYPAFCVSSYSVFQR